MKRFVFVFALINILMFLIFMSVSWAFRMFYMGAFLFFVGSLCAWILANIALIALRAILKRNVLNLLFAAVPLSLWAVMNVFAFFDVPERVDFFFSFPHIKKEFALNTTASDDSGKFRTYGKYIGIIWAEEFLDDYSVIVFDEDDNLLELYKANDEDLFRAFRYDIRDVIKMKKNYYRIRIES